MGDSELGTADFTAMLDLLGATHETAGSEQFSRVLLEKLLSLVRCDTISYNEIGLRDGSTHVTFEPFLVPTPESEEAFARLVPEHPLVSDFVRTGDPRPRLLSEFVSQRQLHRLDLYHEVFRPLETEYQLAFSVAVEDRTLIGLALNRHRSDFSPRDLAVVARLQPHLAAAFDHAVLRGRQAEVVRRQDALSARLSVLTVREREVAALVSGGSTNRRTARALLISERTVEKHVANVLRKLGARSRAELATLLHPVPGPATSEPAAPDPPCAP